MCLYTALLPIPFITQDLSLHVADILQDGDSYVKNELKTELEHCTTTEKNQRKIYKVLFN